MWLEMPCPSQHIFWEPAFCHVGNGAHRLVFFHCSFVHIVQTHYYINDALRSLSTQPCKRTSCSTSQIKTCCSNTESQHGRMTAVWNGEWWHQNKEGVWLRWPLNVAHRPLLQSSVKKKILLHLSLLGNDSPLTARSPTCLSNILTWLLSMSHLSSAATLHWGARNTISSEQLHHDASYYGGWTS